MRPTRHLTVAAFVLSTVLPLGAQNSMNDVLLQIEANNVSLQALRHENEAQRQENRSGITLPDPEVGFGYSWGSPEVGANKINVSVTQSFDLSVVAGLKVKAAKEQDKIGDWLYLAERRRILLEAKKLCIDLVYFNALREAVSSRRSYVEAMMEKQKKRMAQGESDRIEHNNFMLSLAEIQGEFAQIETERRTALTQLKAINGGNPLEIDFTEYEVVEMPEDFDAWYERAQADNPALGLAEQSGMVQQRQLSLSRSQWLPSVSLGYAGEFVGDERLNGLAVGVSVPLWANLHKVNQAKASMQAARYRQEDSRQQFASEMELLYHQTLGLKKVAEIYRTSLEEADNRQLVGKALDEGYISILDYLTQMSLYYEALHRTLDAERNYQKAYAELSAFEL